MIAEREIRASYDRDTIVVYQAYSDDIADAALAAGRFVAPFSFQRMTWIKPSFLWMMHRSNWGQKRGQERIFAVRIRRADWEGALAQAVLTTFQPRIYAGREDWAAQMSTSTVHVQWDPERSLRGGGLPYRSIQVGISRHRIRAYAEQWVVALDDITPQVRKMYEFLNGGEADKAKRLLPAERVYPVPEEIAQRLGMSA